jgi:hypothetical protein
LSFVAVRKRVIKPEGKPEVDLGVYQLSDWLQPDCYAVSKLLIDKIMEKWVNLGGEAQKSAIANVGEGNAYVKLAWNLINTEIRYRTDDDLFNQADFWMFNGECYSMKFGDCLLPDTPLVIKRGGALPEIVEVADLMPEDHPIGQKFYPNDLYIVAGHHSEHYSSSKYFYRVNWLLKKRSDKQVFRVSSRKAIFDLTEDHLILSRDGEGYRRWIPVSRFMYEKAKFKTTKTVFKGFAERYDLSEDWAWLLGFFAAEGYTSPVKAIWRLYNTDSQLIDKALDILNHIDWHAKCNLRTIEFEVKEYDCFKEGQHTNLGKRNKTLKVIQAKARERGSLRKFCQWFRELTYTTLGNKKVPAPVLNAKLEAKKAFIEGFNAGDVKTTTSKVLAFGLIALGERLGVDLRICDKGRNFEIFEANNSKRWLRGYTAIKPIQRDDNIVYDLNVDAPHIFAAGDVFVHNCEDTTFLLTSAVLRLFDVVGDLQMGWWSRWFGGDAPNCFACIGFVKIGGDWFGHAFALYRNPKYQFSKTWLTLETTWDFEVPMNQWLVWNKDSYVPIYFFNKFDSYRLDRDYTVLGVDKAYVNQYWGLIDTMIKYVETGVKTPHKWLHKKIRPAKVETREVRNRRFV